MANLEAGGDTSPAMHPYRWAMLGGVWLIYFCFGLTVAAMAPLVAPIKTDLGIGNTLMGSILGAWPLVYIAAAMPCGMVLDRLGVRRGILVGALVIAASGALRSLSYDHLTLFIAVGVFGIGGPLISVGAPKVISVWFEGPDRGLAMGLYSTGPALGSVTALSLTNSLAMPMADGRWRLVLAFYAGLTVLAALVWVAVAAHRTSRAVERDASERGGDVRASTFLDLLGIPAVQTILVLAVFTFFYGHALTNWLPEILRTGGMTPVAAGYWSSIPTLVGVGAALVIPRLAIPSRRLALLALLMLCGAAATLLLQIGPGLGLAVGLVLQGLVRGALSSIVILFLMETREVGASRMGAAGGLYFSAGEIGGVLGPLTIGALSDLSGGFSIPLYVLTGICGVMLLLLARLRRLSGAGAEDGSA